VSSRQRTDKGEIAVYGGGNLGSKKKKKPFLFLRLKSVREIRYLHQGDGKRG